MATTMCATETWIDAQELIGAPQQAIIPEDITWNKQAKPRSLPAVQNCLREVPTDFVDDQINIRIPRDSKAADMRYRAPGVLPCLPKRCAAPYRRRKPRGSGPFAPDYSVLSSTDEYANNLETIKTNDRIREDAPLVDRLEAQYDFNKLAFYQEGVEMFPNLPYLPNAYVVPESNPTQEPGDLPIYTQRRYQTTWPKEAAHPDIAKAYANVHDNLSTTKPEISLPPRERVFLAKEGITSIVAADATVPDGSLKAPVPVRIQRQFLRGHRKEFELFPVEVTPDPVEGPEEARKDIYTEVRNLVLHEPSIYDNDRSLFKPLLMSLNADEKWRLLIDIMTGEQNEKKAWTEYRTRANLEFQETQDLIRAESRRREAHLLQISQVVVELEQPYSEYTPHEFAWVKRELAEADMAHQAAQNNNAAVAEEGAIINMLWSRLGPVNEKYMIAEQYYAGQYAQVAQSTQPVYPAPGELQPTLYIQLEPEALATSSTAPLPDFTDAPLLPPQQYEEPAVKAQDSGYFTYESSSKSSPKMAGHEANAISNMVEGHNLDALTNELIEEFGVAKILPTSSHRYRISSYRPLTETSSQPQIEDFEQQIHVLEEEMKKAFTVKVEEILVRNHEAGIINHTLMSSKPSEGIVQRIRAKVRGIRDGFGFGMTFSQRK